MRVDEGQVATAIPVPDKSPQSVKDALARFAAVAEKHAAAQSTVSHSKDLLARAKNEDTERNAKDYAAGKEPKNLRAAEEAAEQQIGQAQARLTALTKALDSVGDELADAITAEQESWRTEAAAEADAALADYQAALASMKDALARYGLAKSVAEWLTPVEHDPAKSGDPFSRFGSKRMIGWTGGKTLRSGMVDQRYTGPETIKVRTGPFFKLDDPDDVTKLLPVLATVGEDMTPKTTSRRVNHPADPKQPPVPAGVGAAVTSKEKL